MAARPVESRRLTGAKEDEMTATTMPATLPAHQRISALRLTLALLAAAVLLVVVFAAGRVSAPTHTVQSIVRVPTAAHVTAPVCHVGRPC